MTLFSPHLTSLNQRKTQRRQSSIISNLSIIVQIQP
nr:MAG TPA: hypothetical protein [Caudoviricetes sp.]